MLSYSQTFRKSLIAISLIAATGVLAGCGLTPLYADGTVTRQGMSVAFAEPNSRYEQIVYQELGRSFAPSAALDAPLVMVSVGRGAREITRTINPGTKTSYEMTLTGTITVVKPGPTPQTILTATRHASATYTTDGQVIADNSAEIEASERASRALAETLRLTMLSTFASAANAR